MTLKNTWLINKIVFKHNNNFKLNKDRFSDIHMNESNSTAVLNNHDYLNKSTAAPGDKATMTMDRKFNQILNGITVNRIVLMMVF